MAYQIENVVFVLLQTMGHRVVVQTAPAVRMGRLAVDRGFQEQGLGDALLADALERATRSKIAALSLMVDAEDES
jgi:ribosomal protein S18 acetylase RimI-like enzyme